MRYSDHSEDTINPDDPPTEAIECRYCTKYIPRDREDISPFCSEECEEEWKADYTDLYTPARTIGREKRS